MASGIFNGGRRLSAFLGIGILLLLVSAQAGAKEIVIGLRAHAGAERAMKSWQPTADYLSRRIDGHTFKLAPYESISEMSAAAVRGDFDYVITNPSTYVEMEINSGASRMLTLINKRQGKPFTQFGSVIFTRAERADIESFDDLRGKSLIAVSERGFGGWRVAWGELLKQGIVPAEDLKSVAFAGGQHKVVYAIRDGKADVGVVRTDMLERMAASGLINLADYRNIGQRDSPDFPFLRSSDLYPEWVFAKFPKAPIELSQKVALELLRMSADSPVAKAGKYIGWSVPLNYQPVHNLLKILKVGPYKNFGKVTLKDALLTYRYWIAEIAAVLLVLFATAIFAIIRSRQLAALRSSMLIAKDRELDFQKLALDEHAIVSIADVKGNITYVNDKFCDISGYTREELIGQNHRILKSDKHSPAFYAELWGTIADGETWHGEIKNLKKHGGFYWVQVSIVPFMDEHGKPFQYIAIRTDITERKAAEAALIESREQALAGARAKSDFLANMSHEIRTPMNGVIGMLELLRRTELTDEQIHFADTAIHSADMQISVINDILDFSKIESGKLELEALDIHLSDILEDIAALMGATAQAKGVVLTCYCDPAIPETVKGDPTRLRQVVANLVDNAVKFTGAGEVNIAARFLSQEDGESRVRIEVRDTGIGVDENAQNKLFDPFAQADTSTTRKFGGTGLGLSITNSLIKLMGSKIEVRGEKGIGSTFWFDLSLKTGETTGRRQADELRDLRILAVDDNATNREILESYLSACGMRPTVLDSAGEVLNYLRDAADDVDVMIIDYHMPDMDGLELAQAIFADATIPTPPMIMLSSSQPGDLTAIRQAGIQLRLSKPIGRSRLREGIMSVLGHHRTVIDKADQLETGKLSGKVLLVEDTFINQQVAVGVLAKLGLRPEIANNGREGVEKATERTFDLILMDVQMPEMDGFEATAMLRRREADENLPRTPIIAMTAHALAGDRERCLAAGMDDYISKPVRQQTMEAMLRKWMAGDPNPQKSKPRQEDAAVAEAEISGVLDAEAISILKTALDALPDAYREVLNSFLESVPRLQDDIRAAIEVNDPKAMELAAHSLKSNAATFGAMDLSKLAAEVEGLGRSDEIGNASDLLDKIKLEFARVQPAVARLLSS